MNNGVTTIQRYIHVTNILFTLSDDKGHLFEKKQLSYPEPTSDDQNSRPPPSALSLQLEGFASLGTNPFLEFTKFDGRVGIVCHAPPPQYTLPPPPPPSLSLQLEVFASLGTNPFLEFSKFDGRMILYSVEMSIAKLLIRMTKALVN